MDRFYEHYKEQPTQRALFEFARGNKLPMSVEKRRPFPEALAEWRQLRRERGEPAPNIVKRRGGRGADGRPLEAPNYSENVGAARPGEHLYMGKWTNVDACVEWVTRYLASLGPRQRSTQAGYTRWARQHPSAPVMSTFDQHGGWGAVRRKAMEKLAPTAGDDACK